MTGVYTVLLALFFTTNTSNLTLTMPGRLYNATRDKFHRKLGKRLDDTSNDNKVSLIDVTYPDIPSLGYLVFRSNFAVNLLFLMRYVPLYFPKNMSYPITRYPSVTSTTSWSCPASSFFWPFLVKFLEANCCVLRRKTFVEDFLQGSSGKIMQVMAQAFKVIGDPYNYPIHMTGKTVLKLDMAARPVLTPEQK